MRRASVRLEERGHPLLTQATRIALTGIAGQERKRDRAIEIGEQADRSGPEPLELGAELVGRRDPRRDEILSRA